MYTFPSGDLDRPGKLLSLIGSFWSETYSGGDLVQDLLAARARLDAQNHLDLLALVASMSRLTVPIFRRDNWRLLTLLESQRNATTANLPHYDGTIRYSEAYTALYGTPRPEGTYHIWTLPPDTATARVLLNRITDASLTWTHGTDFFVADGTIAFRTNPFTDDRLIPREVFADGVVVDREIGLWIYCGERDLQTVYTQFGYVLGHALPSSAAYRDFLNGIFDNLVQGTTQGAVQTTLAAILDVPLVREASETVEAVWDDGQALWITTDAHAYRFATGSRALVQPGATVRAGDSLVDTLRFYEFGRGVVPTADQLRALAVGGGLLAHGYYQDLVFRNQDTPLTVRTDDPSGYTRVEFAIEGLPGDVAKFWDDVHAAGVARGRTLAMLLDQRPAPSGQPTALALPATVNPLGFLCQNLFRDNLIVAVVRPGLAGPDALGLGRAGLLRRITPPHTALIVLAELEITGDVAIMDGPGSPDRAGYAEYASVFLGLPIAETVAPTLIQERVRVRQIGGRCG